jgi:hypothetical protein
MSIMESHLRDIASGASLDDFAVIYSDMHGLWGGVTIALSGAGSYERAERPRGAREASIARAVVDERGVREVAALLLAIEGWEQRTPERAPVPDESRATLTIRCRGAQSVIWEGYNELGRNKRIVRVRDHLRGLEHGGASD